MLRALLYGCGLTGLLAFSDPASASAGRTFVSTAGSDANSASNCAPTTPCRTFGAALAVTNVGGEVVVLDSGGYGLMTITQSVSIVIPSGIEGAISVPPGNAGVVINAPGAQVILRGLSISGTSPPGSASGTSTLGIDVVSAGTVAVQDATLVGLSYGVYDGSSGSIEITRSAARGGIIGFRLVPTSGTLVAVIADSVAASNISDGIDAFNNVMLRVDGSLVSMNEGYGVYVQTTIAGATTQAGIANSRLVGNTSGSVYIGDISGANNANSKTGGVLKSNYLSMGAYCVNVAGAASVGLVDNVMDNCGTDVNVAATAYAASTGNNILGGATKTNIGGTINAPLPISAPLY